MKKIYYFMVAAAILISACQQSIKTVPVDTTAVKAEVTSLLDKFNSEIQKMNFDTVTLLLADNGLYCGTDPSEFWDKKALTDLWTQMTPDTTVDFHYLIDKREIRVGKDGNSAVAVEQYTITFLSKNVPVRTVFYVVKDDNKWHIDFLSWAFIPKNEDIATINKAFE